MEFGLKRSTSSQSVVSAERCETRARNIAECLASQGHLGKLEEWGCSFMSKDCQLTGAQKPTSHMQ